MKSVVVSTVIVALAGGTWTWVAPRTDQQNPKPEIVFDAGERVGVKRMLDAREDLQLVNLVVGSDTSSGLRNFRARLIEGGQARPVFGQARRLCNSAPNAAECWEIVLLQVDGKPRLLQSIIAEPEVQNLVTPTEDETVIETGEIPRPIPPEEPQTVTTTPSATHLVARPIINARSGPGVSNPVLFKLSQGARLSQVGENNGWGKFIVLEGESRGAEAWASLSILEALP